MDEDRYYNLGSHDKLFNQIDELTDALASRDAEIESLRQQLAELKGMREEVVHYQKEFHRVRDQLSDHIKREVMLWDAMNRIAFSRIGKCTDLAQELFNREKWATEALAATADLDGLILCHAEPVATVDEDDDNKWATLADNIDIKRGTLLYRAWDPTK